MINYDGILLPRRRQMKESAIRRMGTVLAAGARHHLVRARISGAGNVPLGRVPGDRADAPAGRDGNVLQYGPTRGYRPLLDAIAGIMHQRGVATQADRLLVTTGSQQGLDLVARVLIDPGDVILVELPTYIGAITAFRNVQAAHGRRAAGSDGIDLDALDDTWRACAGTAAASSCSTSCPNFQNPDRPADRARQTRSAARVGRAARRADRRGRSVPRAVLRGLRDAKRTCGRSRRTTRRPRDLPEQLLEDARARLSASPGSPRRRRSPRNSRWPSRPKICCTGALDQRMVYEACRRGILDRQLPLLRAHYAHKRDVMVEALRGEFGGRACSWPDAAGGFFLWVTLPAADRRRRADPARRRARRDLRGRGSVLRRTATAATSFGCRSPPPRPSGSAKAYAARGGDSRRARRDHRPGGRIGTSTPGSPVSGTIARVGISGPISDSVHFPPIPPPVTAAIRITTPVSPKAGETASGSSNAISPAG